MVAKVAKSKKKKRREQNSSLASPRNKAALYNSTDQIEKERDIF
jgi:hypothetical protein